MSARPARADLPPLVARFVERNVPPGTLPARVRFDQVGQMQLKPGRWLRFEAEQEAATERVEFSWRAALLDRTARRAPRRLVSGRERRP